jgi:hypothetical protein
MVRLQAQLSGSDWNNIWTSDQPIVHYFNEPERAGITPQQACDWWFEKMVPLRIQKGKQLVSPSCAGDAAGQVKPLPFIPLIKRCHFCRAENLVIAY